MRRASDCLRADAVLAGLIVALVATAARGQGADRFDWPQASPESQGMSAERLAALKDALARDATHGFLVIRNDKIVCEWYAEGRSTRDKLGTASLAKALVGGMSLAVALSDGLISLDDKAARYVPQWKDDRLKSEITIRNLGSHTSGLKDSQNEEGAKKGLDQYKLPGWEGDFWRWTSAPAAPGKDAFTISRDLAPIVSPPGTEFHYSNPGIGMLTWCVTASLKGTKAPDIRMLLRERVMRPIGVPDDEWACGYDRTEVVDRLPLVASWGGASFSPRAIARIGRLVLREGDWEGTRVLSRDAVRQVATDAGLPGHCGMGWWTNRGGRFGRLPQDALWGAGAGHRVLFIVPSLNLIVVRMGGALSGTPWGSGFYEVLEQHFVNPLMDCFAGKNASSESPAKGACADPLPPTAAQRASPLPLDGGGVGGGGAPSTSSDACPPHPDPPPARGGGGNALGVGPSSAKLSRADTNAPDSSRPPYPPSPVITGIEWDARESIVRRARGSDNWPLTWADDGELYGAYGDGNGFEPFVERKLSLGMARISGGPDDFQGVNVRSSDIEQIGHGPAGKKAGGLLMVDGTLYLWARNAANSQLARSANHGANWTWADWKLTTGFGCPTFLNFGRNYAGARDDFVYVYSADSESAYEAADRMVLARAPKTRIMERSAYEFFNEIDSQGNPRWTRDITRRGAVFIHPARCYRTQITYNPALKRYLWCQVFPESRHPEGPRFQGGFGIYDAPEPWGPWTTVCFTNDWDVGPGETCGFPAKWISDDGRTLHLVFSGDDCFSVRRARLRTTELRN